MSGVSGREAINYATSPELLLLYGGFLVYWILRYVEGATSGIFPGQVHVLNSLLSYALLVAAVGVLVVTIVAIAHKVLRDSV